MGCDNSKQGQEWAHSNHGTMPANQNGTQKVERTGEVGQAALERYIQLESLIAEAEKTSPKMVLDHKREQLKQIGPKTTEQELVVERLEENTRSEETVLNQVLEMTTEGDVIDEKTRETMAALNSQEIAKKELDSLREQKAHLEKEISEVESEVEKLQGLYDEQEAILNEIFGGEYGSEEENRHENVLDSHEQMRSRIVEANFKWRQAQLMVDYAYKQLEFAVGKWNEIPAIDATNLEGRYAIASETRNNLVAAAQNIQGAQGYLSNVQFPYCAPPEVDTLNKATAYIFTDMQTADRHEHAQECYTITSKRCGALLQWINQVVTQTISRDLDEINAKVKEASLNLRRERVRLIKLKVKEELGRDIDISVADVNTDVLVNLNLNDLAKTEGIDPNELGLTPEELAALNLMGQEDLAPPPSSKEVFGEQVEELTKGYMDDNSRIENQLAENNKRVAQSLEQKLAARRQRRARKGLEEKELSVLVK